MKEISKLSGLVEHFLLDIENKMGRENKDIKVYDIWEEVMQKEGMIFDVSLEDVRDSSLIVYVKHPGMAQQIRFKSKKILAMFKERLPTLKLNKIVIMIKDEFKY